ncbi:MAG: lysine 2,3-aminomutase [bacterium]|nr:lysine 2,3-aminomutase [bacterium]
MEILNSTPERYRPVVASSISKSEYWELLPEELQEVNRVVSKVFPFRTNEYVLRELIDWDRVPDDPMYQLTFPQRAMLEEADYERIRSLLERGASRGEIRRAVTDIRWELNPHPAGQMTHNVPTLEGRSLEGLQHKYDETVLFFPGQGQTCHAYCTYCFRWAQFVDLPDMRFQARETADLIAYLKAHSEVTDVLITGGDPMVMKTRALRRYIEPLLSEDLPHLRHIRIGTKSLAYWPQRYVTDDDADDLLRLFEQVRASGRHLAVMAHCSHPVELEPEIAQEAVRRVLGTGAQIRMQAPVVRHVNDAAGTWAQLWRRGVRLGMIPYYMFVERDTGPKRYFEVPLARAYQIFRHAYSRMSGLARTVRGPSMSAFPGKVRVLGTNRVAGQQVFILDFIQARRRDWVRRPFFARFSEDACWFDELEPVFDSDRIYFEREESPDDEIQIAV